MPADILASLDSDGPLHPMILDTLGNGVIQGSLIILDWYTAPWVRDGNGRPRFYIEDVDASVKLAYGAVPSTLTRYVVL